MKGFFRYLSPFSPDQSGAVSVLYELGGIIVILDAGGCAGNICGFDEPRWFKKPSAIYSAGLRNLDAILGRDDRLIKKIEGAVKTVENPNFIALIGTPVPAVVGTDLKALATICEKRYGLPALATETFGMEYYDKGMEEAYNKIFGLLKKHNLLIKDETTNPFIGVLGCSPLELPAFDSYVELKKRIKEKEQIDSICFGMEQGLEGFRKILQSKKILLVSPSGIELANTLYKEYGIPYEYGFNFGKECGIPEGIMPTGKTLIITQQILGNSLRDLYKTKGYKGTIDVGTFFLLDKNIKKENDFHIESEDELKEKIIAGKYDTVVGDPLFKRIVPNSDCNWISLPHYPVSAEIHQVEKERSLFK